MNGRSRDIERKRLNLREARYWPMRAAILDTLPDEGPGMKFEELVALVTPVVDPALFPAPKTVEWYARVVQLDLEARKLVERTQIKDTLLLHRTPVGAAEARGESAPRSQAEPSPE